MDISKAKKLVELTKGDRKILVTVYEGGQVSSCVTEKPPLTESLEFPPLVAKQYCETCQADDETCRQWIEHLKKKGYQATEIELSELGLEESLPKFLEENVHANIEAAEAVPGSPGEIQPGESGGGSPETS